MYIDIYIKKKHIFTVYVCMYCISVYTYARMHVCMYVGSYS